MATPASAPAKPASVPVEALGEVDLKFKNGVEVTFTLVSTTTATTATTATIATTPVPVIFRKKDGTALTPYGTKYRKQRLLILGEIDLRFKSDGDQVACMFGPTGVASGLSKEDGRLTKEHWEQADKCDAEAYASKELSGMEEDDCGISWEETKNTVLRELTELREKREAGFAETVKKILMREQQQTKQEKKSRHVGDDTTAPREKKQKVDI